MNTYLQRCRSVLKTAVNKIAVIGNESCDLDSVVSSIAFAFHLQHAPKFLGAWCKEDTTIFPVLNVTRTELPLKTEVTFYLKRQGIALEDLICRDDIEWNAERTLNVVLVDHHVSKLEQNIIGIVDHRPVENNARFDYAHTIELVGSCATLVGRVVLQDGIKPEQQEGYKVALQLLYGAIVLDTVNFSKQADKAKPLDYEVAAQIETHLQIAEETRSLHREQLFKSLVDARCDVSELNAYQLLLKDLKIISQNSRTVSVPGFPMAVQEFLKLPERKQHLDRFACSTGSNVVVLLGMKVLPDGSVRRDVGVVPIDDKPLAEKIIAALHACEEMNFELKEITCPDVEGTFYQQHNLKASRKQLMPIVKSVLSTIQDYTGVKTLPMFLYTAGVIGMSVAFFTLCLCDLHHMLYSRDLLLFTIQSSSLIKHLYKSGASLFQCLADIDGHLYALNMRLAAQIETHLQIAEETRSLHREQLFKSLVDARCDVSELNAYQLLLKDLKIISQNSRTVSVPGFPMAVQEFLKLPERKQHLDRFACSTGSNVVVLLGMKVLPDGSVRRDVGVVPIDDKPLAEKIIAALHACEEMNFELKEITCPDVEGTFYQQHNLKASRKQLMPIVKSVLSTIQ
uniref:DHHA2 domain-containing protein n=1 Tax=Anopheles epiroticus TaxID=199890 RepID=A0A182PYX4_9DIPT